MKFRNRSCVMVKGGIRGSVHCVVIDVIAEIIDLITCRCLYVISAM